MSLMDSIETPRERPVIVTICGDSGMGKTNLAATFPKPIFIRVEDGLQAVPAERRNALKAFPLVNKAEDLFAQVRALIEEEHDFQTLVIDSVTAAERLFIADVMASDPKNPRGIQQALGGYGAGRDAVAAMHGRLRKGVELLLQRRGMNTVFIAHADTQRMEPPDSDAYMRYTLRLHERSIPPYVDDVDVVGFLRLQTFVMGDGDRKKAMSDGTRELVTHASAANVSKNRFGITEPLEVKLGENPLKKYIRALNVKENDE